MSVVSPRRTQVERSANTRRKLASAAFDLIQNDGFANFRVAFVAKEAGVSQGGQLHHFPTKDEMTLAAIEYGLELALIRTKTNLAAFRANEDVITAISEDCRDYYFSPSFDVALDVIKGSASKKQLREQIAKAHREYRKIAEDDWHKLLINRGWSKPDASDLIEMTASLVRGFAIRAMIRPNEKQVTRLMNRWKQMVQLSFQKSGKLS